MDSFIKNRNDVQVYRLLQLLEGKQDKCKQEEDIIIIIVNILRSVMNLESLSSDRLIKRLDKVIHNKLDKLNDKVNRL